jgi:hypothetical protein
MAGGTLTRLGRFSLRAVKLIVFQDFKLRRSWCDISRSAFIALC